MPSVLIRDADEHDASSIAGINAASEAVTSPMDANRFRRLLPHAALARVACTEDVPVAFVLGFAEGAQYDGDNFRWFEARMRRFLYIDRVVISEACRRSGIGRRLYDDALAAARRRELLWLVAEIDVDPPNPGSLRFHQAHGFREIGVRRLTSGKQVSMQVLGVDTP